MVSLPAHPTRRAFVAALALAIALGQPAVVQADPPSPLNVDLTASPSPVVSGSQLTYTIVTTNTGGAKVNNVVLTDQVNGIGVIQSPPALPQFVITSDKGSCSQGGSNGNVVTCNAGTLNGGEAWTVTIRGQVTAPHGATLNNTATVTATKSAQTFTTSDTTQVLVDGGTGGGSPLPDLTINKTGPTSVAAGADMAYTLTVNNVGTANASGIVVIDTLPAGVGFVSTSTTSLFTCAAAGAPVTVTCSGGAVNQGQNGTITINATAPDPAPTPNTITNTAVVDPGDAIAESNELNNTSASVNTTVGGPPPEPLLSILKTDNNPDVFAWSAGAGPDPVNPGEALTYKIQVVNNAASRADDVVVTDGTQGLEASSIVASQVITDGNVGNTGGCIVIAPQVRCSVRWLNAGGTLTLTITGTVIAAAGSTIFNTATVNGNIKNVGVTDTDSEETIVRPQVDLTITKADSPDPACARTWPRDLPPAGETGPLPNDPIPPAPPGAAGQVEPPHLLASAACLGGLTYDFVIGNSGNGDATNVTVRDPLPAGVILDSYDTDGGFSCGVQTGNVVLCTGGSIPAASTRHLSFRLVAPPSIGTITNVATVDPNNAQFEPDETNNTASATTTITSGVDLVVWKGDKLGQDVPGDGAPNLAEGFDPIATNGTGTYTIIVDNVGPQDVTGIKVRDTLPAGTKFLSVSADAGFTCSHDGSATGGNVTCIGGHLPGTATEFYEEAGAPPPAPSGDQWATIKIKFSATAFVQPAMHNEVRVDPDNEIAEINEQNNFAFDNTTVGVGNNDQGAFNQLTVTKTHFSPTATCPPGYPTPADPDPVCVAQNGTLIYDLEVKNLGTDPASQIVVKDYLPAGSRFLSAGDTDVGTGTSDAFFCVHDGSPTGGTVTCLGGDLSGTTNMIPDSLGGVVPTTRHIRIKVFAPGAPGMIQNLASVDPDNALPEGNEFDNDSLLVTRVTVGGNNMFNDLTISKCDEPNPPANDNGCSVDSDPVAPSGQITYVLKVANGGTDPAFNVKVTDNIPTGTTFVSAADTVAGAGAFDCAYAAGVVTCTGATIDGTSDSVTGVGTVRFIEIVLTAPAAKGPITNQAFVDPGNAIPEGDETNNADSETTNIVPRINLTLDKNGPDTAHQNDVDEYVITVTNEAPTGDGLPAYDVHVWDVLPVGLIPLYVQADPSNFICELTENPVNGVHCFGDMSDPDETDPNVPDTSTVTITIGVFITAQEGPLDNEACVDPTDPQHPNGLIIESEEGDNCKTKTTEILKPAPDLNVNKQADVSTAAPGQTITYTIGVSNVGDATAMGGFTITDDLTPDGAALKVDFISVAATNGYTCTFTPPDTVECQGGSLAPGDATTITIKVKVQSGATGSVLNEVSVPDNTAFDPLAPECGGGGCANEGDPNTSSTNANNSDTASVSLTGTGIDLVMLTLDDDPDAAAPGGLVTYTAAVSNNGTDDADDAVVRLTLPPTGLTHVISSATNGFTCDFLFPSIDCTGDLPAGGTTEVTLVTQVTAAAPPDTSVTVTAAVDPAPGTITEDDETNNVKSQTTTVSGSCSTGCVDLVASPVVATPDPVAAGELVTFYVGVGNAGDQATSAFDISLKLTGSAWSFDGGFQAAQPSDDYSATPGATTGFDCAYSLGDTVTCNGDLAGGQGVLIILKVRISDPPTDNGLTLMVTADPGDANVTGEFSELNNEASGSVTVGP